jgi:23S rRNA pseudouridine2457 synthase
MIIAFHKPYSCLSQFTDNGSNHRTLREFNFPSDVYPIGRLDADSEGLLLLTNEKKYIDRLLHPSFQHRRTYWAQVENIPTNESLAKLEKGIIIEHYKTLPCEATILSPQPQIAPRIPPIRIRKNIPDCWIALTLIEGKNRQVRKMTAAVGHPTLRLLRIAIGNYALHGIEAGNWKILTSKEINQVFQK